MAKGCPAALDPGRRDSSAPPTSSHILTLSLTSCEILSKPSKFTFISFLLRPERQSGSGLPGLPQADREGDSSGCPRQTLEEPRLEVSSGSRSLGKYAAEEEEELREPRGWTPGEYGPQPHLGRARRGSGTKVSTVEPASTCARSPACMSDCWLGVLGERLTVKVGVSLTLLPAPRTLSLHWAASSSFNVRVCGWTYCVLGGVWCRPWEACSSLGEGGE